MPIKIGQPFERTSKGPIDLTLTLTKAEMLTVNDELMPDKYFTICQDDGKIYLYDKTATPSLTTGKFSLFAGDGEHVALTQAEYDALSDEEKDSDIIFFITDGSGGGGGSSLPSGGTTGQVLAKKSDADGDVEWKDIVIPSDWGIAKIGYANVSFNTSAWSTISSDINISDLGLTSIDDYEVLAQPCTGGTATPWGNAIAYVNYDRTVTSFKVGAYSPNTEQLDGTVVIKYVVFAKGFGSNSGGGGSSTYTAGEGIDITNNIISVTEPTVKQVELTQAEYNALSEEEKKNGEVYFITDGGTYVPAVDIIPYGTQEPIIVGKFDLRGDGEYRNVYRIRRWISNLKNASSIITAGWAETGVYIRPLRIYGSFTFHDRESTSTGWKYNIQQFPIPYSGYEPAESSSGAKIGLKFYVDHNNKLRMVVEGKNEFSTDDFAQVIIDYIETPTT